MSLNEIHPYNCSQLTVIWYENMWDKQPNFELTPDVHDLEIRDQGSQIVLRYKTSFLLGEGERILHNSTARYIVKHGEDVLLEKNWPPPACA